MILVIVGTHSQGFERLVHAADELAALIDEEVIIQYGSSIYKPKTSIGHDWLSYAEIERLTKEARIVIAHAGAGTIISTLNMGKPLVIAPRLARNKEHHNDHQLQLATALQLKKLAIVVQELSGEKLRLSIADVVRLEQADRDKPLLIRALVEQFDIWYRKDLKE